MIELNTFQRQWAEIRSDVLAAIERVGASGRYILGKEVAQFEAEVAKYCDVAHAVGVGNGMDAIEIGLRALGLRDGDQVLTTPFSAFATTLAIVRAGGIPVFVDVDDNGNVDLAQAGHALRRDRGIRFFVPVHLYGNPLDLEKLAKLKRDFGITVVEDCAQAIGARFGDRQVGTIGDAAALSFYPTKNLGALGDAGAVLTNDAAVAQHSVVIRHYGQCSRYLHQARGLNSRLDELHAAVLHEALLPRLQSWTNARRAIAASYLSSIADAHVRPLNIIAAAQPVWHLFPLFADSQNEFTARLNAQGIETAVHYPRIIPDQPAMSAIQFQKFAEPHNARSLAAIEVSIPIHPFLSETERDRVIRACRERPEPALKTPT